MPEWRLPAGRQGIGIQYENSEYHVLRLRNQKRI